jgi:hypothetical protein
VFCVVVNALKILKFILNFFDEIPQTIEAIKHFLFIAKVYATFKG